MVMEWSLPFLTVLFAASAVCNVLFSLLFFYLRYRVQAGLLTKSQRFGLSLLWAIFLVNGVELAFLVLTSLLPGPPGLMPFPECVYRDLEHVNYLLILAFGVVFPRPILEWRRQRYLLLLLGVLALAVVALPMILAEQREYPWLYFGSVFLFPLVWLWHSLKERSDQVRMVLVLLAWGFLFTPFTENISHRVDRLQETGLLTFIGDTVFLFLMGALALILYGLHIRRGGWAAAEKLNIIFLSAATLVGVVSGAFRTLSADTDLINLNNSIQFLYFLSFPAGWMVIRPLLFSIGLLRYQLFGMEVRADILLRVIGWAGALVFIAAFVQGFLGGVSTETRLVAGFVASAAAAYPCWLAVRRVVARLLPLSAGESVASMTERRSSYLMALQTAVVGGVVKDDFDARALENLRKKLGISEREHSLLLTFFPKPEKVVERPEIHELFLIQSSGVLVAHAGRRGEEKEMVAGMLTAIRAFMGDTLSGAGAVPVGRRELDTVRYGDYNLIMESEGNLVLAALVLGPETPDVRVVLRDTLAGAAQHVPEPWDGDIAKVAGAREALARTMAPALP